MKLQFNRKPKRRSVVLVCFGIILAVVAGLISSCGSIGHSADDFASSMSGRAATMSTFDENGNLMDQVKGVSLDARRDATFDSKNPDGSTNEDSSVLSISIGGHFIHHVGSTMILADDGLNRVTYGPTQVELQNTEPGTPWLNRFYRSFSDKWAGQARTIIIKSQNGTPIAVYAGNTVETYAADIPKTTWFVVDGKNLLVYRADYTVYDTELLGR